MGPPVLELRGISKSFGRAPALRDVSLRVEAGSLHALVGENGAGKSTLLHVLFGMPIVHETGGFTGEILVDGRPVRFRAPHEALAAGIGMVHQELMLLPGLSVAENVTLGREPARRTLASRLLGRALEHVDARAMADAARSAAAAVGLHVPVEGRVGALPIGLRQLVEIAREVDRPRMRLLVLDEPTAALAEAEAQALLDVLRALTARGLAVLLVTHRLAEVLAAADAITVLRDGAVAGRPDPRSTDLAHLGELLVGHAALERTAAAPPAADAPVALAVEHLAVDFAGEHVRDVSFALARGEILGLAGLGGQGKLAVANGIMGLAPARGRVLKDGRPLPLGSPAAALRRGLAFVPEDRRHVGLDLDASIAVNLVLPAVQAFARFLRPRLLPEALRLLDRRAVAEHARRLIETLDIRCAGPSQPVRELSGGNQQKVALGRALTLEPDVLLVSEPTRGIDVGARARILETLLGLQRERGLSLLVTSSELGELRAIASRIAVVERGRIAAVLPPDAPDAAFGLALGGASGGALAG